MTLDAKKILKIISFSVFLIFIIVYAFFRSKDLIFGVKIKNMNLKDGSNIVENTIDIKGNAKNAVNLTLNDRVISLDQAGNFKETLALFPGYNIISVNAEDEFGNSDEKNYKLMH